MSELVNDVTSQNWITVPPEYRKKYFGFTSNSEMDGYIAIFSSIFPDNKGLNVSFTREFTNLIEKVKSKSIDTDYISFNLNHVIKFRSGIAYNLYVLISKHQPFTNFIEISVEDLARDLQTKSGYSKDGEFSARAFLKTFPRVAETPAFLNSTCALKKVSDQYYVITEREGQKAKRVRLSFKSNQELENDLLSLPYTFIKHLLQYDPDKIRKHIPDLVQLIALVHDQLTPEGYVNYLINRIYDYRSAVKAEQHNNDGGIFPLLKQHLEKKSYWNDFIRPINDPYKVLADEPGVSMFEILKKAQQKRASKLVNHQTTENTGKIHHSPSLILEGIPGIEKSFIDYINNHELTNTVIKRIDKVKEKNRETFVKDFVLSDFRLHFQDQIEKIMGDILQSEALTIKVMRSLDNDVLYEMFKQLDLLRDTIHLTTNTKNRILNYCENHIL